MKKRKLAEISDSNSTSKSEDSAKSKKPKTNTELINFNDKHLQDIKYQIDNFEKTGIEITLKNYYFTNHYLDLLCREIDRARNITSFSLSSCSKEQKPNDLHTFNSRILKAIKYKQNITTLLLDISNIVYTDLTEIINRVTFFNFSSIQNLTIQNLELKDHIFKTLVEGIERMTNLKNLSFENSAFKTLSEVKKFEKIFKTFKLDSLKINNCIFAGYNSIMEILSYIKLNDNIKSVEFKDIKFTSYDLAGNKSVENQINLIIQHLTFQQGKNIKLNYLGEKSKEEAVIVSDNNLLVTPHNLQVISHNSYPISNIIYNSTDNPTSHSRFRIATQKRSSLLSLLNEENKLEDIPNSSSWRKLGSSSPEKSSKNNKL